MVLPEAIFPTPTMPTQLQCPLCGTTVAIDNRFPIPRAQIDCPTCGCSLHLCNDRGEPLMIKGRSLFITRVLKAQAYSSSYEVWLEGSDSFYSLRTCFGSDKFGKPRRFDQAFKLFITEDVKDLEIEAKRYQKLCKRFNRSVVRGFPVFGRKAYVRATKGALQHTFNTRDTIPPETATEVLVIPAYMVQHVPTLTLQDYLKVKELMSQTDILKLTVQILTILTECRRLGFTHADINPGTIGLNGGDVFLIDWAGLTKLGNEWKFCRGQYHVYPEFESAITQESELYSLGVTLLQACFGLRDYQNPRNWRDECISGGSGERLIYTPFFSEFLDRLLAYGNPSGNSAIKSFKSYREALKWLLTKMEYLTWFRDNPEFDGARKVL